MCWKSGESFEVEETNKCSPNVVTFKLMMGEDWFYVMGAYISPSELDTLEQVQSAWVNCPTGCIPMLLEDLNRLLLTL